MAHVVFISYASSDAGMAQSICTALEQGGLRCWIAPRDITPGVKYAAALVDAISNCRVFVLVLSAASNESPQVEMEVDRAASKNIPILCFRIDDVSLSKTLEYYLSSRHWLDASRPPLEGHIQNLVQTTRNLVAGGGSVASIPKVRALSPAGRVADEERLWENPLVVVSRGREAAGGQQVLVTRVRSRMVPAGDFLARYELLEESLNRVETGHLAKLVDYGEQDGRAVVVEQAPAGRRLAELAWDGKALPETDVLQVAAQLGETLNALYKRNLLQLVFDPQAVWLSEEGRVVASQGGIAQGVNMGRLLSSGKLEPTPWHAPELRQGEPGDMRTDFYSLGALLYLLLTGKEPEPGKPGDRTPAPGELNPSRQRESLNMEWDDLVGRCLQPNPARRIQSVAEYNSKLEEVRRGLEQGGKAPAEGEDSLVGQTLGGYQLVEKLGQGGMASVYKAYESALDRYVAVKVLPAFLAGDANFAQRFRREAKAVAHLSHPNIIPIYSFGEEQGIPYIAMQLMQGGTLKQPDEQVYSPEAALRMLLPVTRALEYAHQHGIVHRDIKPSNILLTEDQWPVIADFGLVQMAEASARLTTSGVGLGTPAYMSPEQGQGGKVDARSDIYSLGIVLYEMVTGEVPFHATTPMGVLLKHASEPIPPARRIKPGIPKEVEDIIRKAAAKDPQERYQSAGGMAEALEQALGKITAPAWEKPVEKATRVKPGKVERKKEVEKKDAERKPIKLHLPRLHIKPVHLIAGGAALALVLAGIIGSRLFTKSGNPSLPYHPALGAETGSAPAVIALPTGTANAAPTVQYWSKLSGDLSALYRDQVNVIAVDPKDAQTIYLGTQNSGIYKSTNGGDVWVPASTGLGGMSIGSLVIDPGKQILYAGVYGVGVFRSKDGGESWQMSQPNINSDQPECSNVVMDPMYPHRLYYSDRKNLFATENEGDSWTQVDFNLAGMGLCNFAIAGWDDTNMWGSVNDQGFYFSADKGTTWSYWEPWTAIWPDFKTHDYKVWLDPYVDGRMYVWFWDFGSSAHHLLQTADKGATWTDQLINCQAWMAFDPENHEVAYCVGGDTLWITEDGGQSWNRVKNFPENKLFSIAIPSSQPAFLYLGTGGVLFSGDGGMNWKTLSYGMGAVKYAFIVNPGSTTDLFLLEENKDFSMQFLKHLNDGTWQPVDFSEDAQYLSFDNYGGMYKSIGQDLWKNAGTGADKIASLESGENIRYVFHPFKQDWVFGTGDPTYLFFSENEGGDWDKVVVDKAATGRFFFTVKDPDTIFSGTGSNAWISHDLGGNWTSCGTLNALMPDSATAAAIDARPSEPNPYRIYVATHGAGLLVSNDDCQTWTSITSPFRNLEINSVVFNINIDSNAVYVGTDDGAYVSHDRGNTWSEISGIQEGVIYSFLMRQDGSVLAATPFGIYKLEGK